MNIRPTDLVLEVGSGNNPNPRSDILCDRFLNDDYHRAGRFRIVINRPLMVADGYNLPFRDKSFDYIICSHTLEHMEDPDTFVSELCRVGKAGYIEVPSAVSERIFGWDFHLWYCEKSNDTLFLRKKKGGVRFGGFFHTLIAGNIWFRRFFEENESEWYVRIEWKNKLSIRTDRSVIPSSYIAKLDQHGDALLSKLRVSKKSDFFFFIRWMTRRLIRKIFKVGRTIRWLLAIHMHRDKELQKIAEIVICPQCRGALGRSTSGLYCQSCKELYPMDGVIPVMLPHHERRKGY